MKEVIELVELKRNLAALADEFGHQNWVKVAHPTFTDILKLADAYEAMEQTVKNHLMTAHQRGVGLNAANKRIIALQEENATLRGQVEAAQEVAWVIEFPPDERGVLYWGWTSGATEYLATTPDNEKALRFSRMEDAANVIRFEAEFHPFFQKARPIEHMWIKSALAGKVE